MDSKLINEFRARVNKDDWVLHQYRNVNGRNKWNIICSAMDWINVSVEEIDITKLSRTNDNQASILVMKFISCIDVLWEGICQLHRVFFNTKNIPFHRESTIFSDKIVDKCDNEYFKTIRACFSAHPINIDENINTETKASKAQERWYASWSGGGFGKRDFSVILYSNNPEQDDVYFDISFDELMRFAQTRYNYLNIIMKEIDRQQNEYILMQQTKPIRKCKDPVEQIKILIGENNKRSKNDYYNYVLRKLDVIFSTSITSSPNKRLVDTYREVLHPMIAEIFCNIQMMKNCELELENLTEINAPSPVMYTFSKLCEHVFGEGGYFPIDGESFAEYVGNVIDLSDFQTYDELYVLVLTGEYFLAHSVPNT